MYVFYIVFIMAVLFNVHIFKVIEACFQLCYNTEDTFDAYIIKSILQINELLLSLISIQEYIVHVCGHYFNTISIIYLIPHLHLQVLKDTDKTIEANISVLRITTFLIYILKSRNRQYNSRSL